MNKQKLATAGCIVLSIVFSLSIVLFTHFKAFLPHVNNIYEKILYYPEDLYVEYEKEAVRMIAKQEYTSDKYPVKTDFNIENGKIILTMKIGNYDEHYQHSTYMTVTVKNLGTDEQETIFERNKKSAEDAYNRAENYKNWMTIYTTVFVLIFIIITVFFIQSSIKKHFRRVFITMLFIIAFMAIIDTIYILATL